MTNDTVGGRSLVTSYMTLRKFIGILGFALPGLLLIGGRLIFGISVQPSISAYYHTGMGDVLVGTMCAIGVFMLSYRGYESRDDYAGNLACVFAVGVALFPTAPPGAVGTEVWIGRLHNLLAAGFFGVLIYFCLRLFTMTNPDVEPTPQKLVRNRIYRTCGYVMLASIVLIGVFELTLGSTGWVGKLRAIFWLEAVAIAAFGVSWLIKGEAILSDQKE